MLCSMSGSSECRKCGYRWSHPGKRPTHCPSCRSTSYDSDEIEICSHGGGICDICGCEFITAKILQDHFCPNCGSDKWCNKKLYVCLKCGHKWYSLLLRGPTRCPHSVYLPLKKGAALRKTCGSTRIKEVKD